MSERAPPTVSRVARGVIASTEDGSFLQERVKVFARTMFLLMTGYFTVMITAALIFGFPLPIVRSGAPFFAATGLAVISATWWIARGRPRAARTMALLEGVLVADLGFGIALNAYLFRELRVAPMIGYVGISMFVLGRALIIPSTPQRTALVSTLGVAPLIVTSSWVLVREPELALITPYALQLAAVPTWCTLAVALASYGSKVIYGLRAQVREAQQLGQYTLIEKIGEGGMGAVYRARHAMLRRATAVKLLGATQPEEKQLQRFEREVQLTAELAHPNIVQIYDYGRSAEGVFYYAMELLDGLDLDTLVERFGPQPPARVVHILCQVCSALAEAHERGLVHRDVKPANVFLCERVGVPDVAKVLDFGLVKDLEPGSTKLTDMNVVAGTPGFLAPEAITSPEALGPAADLYAVGAVGYYLVTGKLVFEGKTVVEIASHHVHTRPEPPSQRLGQPLPEALEQLILRCLAKKPADRPASARLLRRALMDVAEQEPWRESEAEAWWRSARVTLSSQAPPAPSPSGYSSTVLVDVSGRAAEN